MFYNQIQPLMQSASNQNQHRANSSTNDAWEVVGFPGSLTRKGFALPVAALGIDASDFTAHGAHQTS